MTTNELIKKRRTIRRFKQEKIALDILKEIVDNGRLAPSGSNLQPLEFIAIDNKKRVRYLYEHTRWAGYLPELEGKPKPEQAPVAYIAILVNHKIRPDGGGADVGAAAENMILTALEKGVGACWIGSIIDRPDVKSHLKILEHYDLDCVLALGYPEEEPVVENMGDSVKYYRDSAGILHVPKRTLEQVFHHNSF